MRALLLQLEKPIRDAWLKAIAEARSFANIKALMSAIVSGDENAILRAAGIREGMYSSFTESLRSAYLTSGADVIARELPKAIAMSFDITNPRAESWLRNYSSQRTQEMNAETRGAVRKYLERGMRLGDNPRSVALDIVGRIGATGRRTGGAIELTEYQAGIVNNLRDDLDNLDLERYKKRKLRDRRFDKLVERHAESGKPIPKAKKQQIVNRYEDRFLKHRGDTIGRTEAIRATSEASEEAMRQVVDEGYAPRDSITRIWQHSFSINEREGHKMMHGQKRGMDETFLNPITKRSLKYPGDGPASEAINCRCWLKHKIDFVKVEQAA
jgi:hypothetical protein